MSFRESELMMFWQASTEYHRGSDRADALDDILMIARMTEWPRLKKACAKMLAPPPEIQVNA